MVIMKYMEKTESRRGKNGQRLLYAGFVVLLLFFSFFYMQGQIKKAYRGTEKLSCDGMYPGDKRPEYLQEVTLSQDSLYGFSAVFYRLSEECNDVVRTQLRTAEDEVIQSWERSALDFETDDEGAAEEVFLLDEPIGDAGGKTYKIYLEIVGGSSKEDISVSVSASPGEQFTRLIMGEREKTDMCLQARLLGKRVSQWQVVLFALLALAAAAASFFAAKLPPEKVLPVVFAVIGTAYFIFIPMLQVPDEKGHYYRSYEISQGDFLTPNTEIGGYSDLPGNMIPERLEDLSSINYEKIRDSLTERLDKENRESYENKTQALYSPVNYLPQALGCLVGRLFTDRTVVIFYMGRLFNFLACGAIVWLAVKYMPFGKRFLILMACMPIYLQQMVSLSSDAFINAWAFLLIALVMRLLSRKEKAESRELILLAVSCGFVALCKVVYLPLCFLVLCIPKEKFPDSWGRGSIRRAFSQRRACSLWYKAVVCAVSAILNLGWMAIGFGYMVEFRAGVDTAAQIKDILTHPVSYLSVVLRTCGDKIIDWLGTMVGAKLGILNVYTCLSLVVVYLVFLAAEMLFLDRQEKNFLSGRQKVIFVLLFFMIFGITLTSLYAQWTAYRNPYIEGFQGRYFIPILPLLALSGRGAGNAAVSRLSAGKKAGLFLSEQEVIRWELALVAVINVTALFSVVTYYA